MTYLNFMNDTKEAGCLIVHATINKINIISGKKTLLCSHAFFSFHSSNSNTSVYSEKKKVFSIIEINNVRK